MLAIVILNFNNSKDTIECLKSLKSLRNRNFNIFLGDNSTNIEEYEKVLEFIESDYELKNITRLYRINDNRGFGAGNNFLLKKIDLNIYSKILLLNNDTIISNFNIIDVLEKKKCEINDERYIIGCKLLNEDLSYQESRGDYPKLSNEVKYYLKKVGVINKEKYDYLSGAFLLFSSKLIEEVGYFDERYFLYFEETDLIFRAKSIGYKTYYVPEIDIIHKGGKSTGKLNQFTVEEYYKSMNIFCSKNLEYTWEKWIIYLFRNVISLIGIISMSPFLFSNKKYISAKNKIEWCKITIKKSHLLLKDVIYSE